MDHTNMCNGKHISQGCSQPETRRYELYPMTYFSAERFMNTSNF